MNCSNQNKKTVLFLCTGNSARSQMAEALLRHSAGDQFSVFSAGTRPEEIDARALSVLAMFDVSSAGLASNNVSDFNERVFDYVITLCDSASLECRDFEHAQQQMAWDFPDPKVMTGLNPFATTLHALNNRISLFIQLETIQLETKAKTTSVEVNPVLKQSCTNVEPTVFYKCLTDDIRLKTLMLANYHGELCVCELMHALGEDSQPKVSRNLAVLKKAGIITDRKRGQWVFYRINVALPIWLKNVISETTNSNVSLIENANQRLFSMRNRPGKESFCR
jgi:ArsR family transcriptional regulator